MSLLRNLAGGLRGLFRKQQVEREMDEELRGYLDAAVNDKMRRGLDREQAVRAARIEMGGAESVKQRVRAASWESLVETLWQDLKFGLRLLRFSPAFEAAAILSLALGIGANTAIFQLLDAIRLRALPVKMPQELALVQMADMTGARGSFNSAYPAVTNPLWERIRDTQQAFSGLLAWSADSFNLATSGEPRFARGLWVSGDFFRVLGIQPVLGRVFTTADDQRGNGLAE